MKTALICLLFLAICSGLYSNSLNYGFMFDDDYLVAKNLYIKDASFIPKLFKTGIFHFYHHDDLSVGKYYRPLQALSYLFDYSLWKLNPAGYRATNIAIHSLNSFLLYLIIFLLFKNRALALLSSIIFLIHPIQSFLVILIAGRSNLLETLFVFSSLASFIYFTVNHKRMYYILSLTAFVSALLSREGALLLPIFILFVPLFIGISAKKTITGLIPFLVLSVFYIALHMKFMPIEQFHAAGIFSLKNAGIFAARLADYFQQLILPAKFYAPLAQGSVFLKYLLFVWVLLIVAYALFRAVIYRDKIVVFALAFYVMGLLPAVKLNDTISYFGKVLSEHYVYIASAGFCLLIAHLILNVRSRFKAAFLVNLILVVAGYSVLTISNNTNYRDEITFYKHVLNVDQDHTFVRVNLGTAYLEKKMYSEAEKEARLVLASEGPAWDAYLLLGNIMMGKGKLDEAKELYKKALFIHPGSAEALNNMALLCGKEGKDEEAYEFFRKAVAAAPESLLSLKSFSEFLVERKKYDEAITVCEKILTLDRSDAGAYVTLGVIFAESGRLNEAEGFFNKALRLNPSSFGALKNLGALYGNKGDLEKAISIWGKALSLNPEDEEVRNNIKEAKRLEGAIAR